MSITRSIGTSIILSAILASLAKFAGLGWKFGVVFGIALCFLLPLFVVLYTQTTRVESNNTITVEPLIRRPAGKILLTIVYLFVLYAWHPVILASVKNQRPMTYRAMFDLMVRDDITTALYLQPTDVAQKLLFLKTLDEQAALLGQVTATKLTEIENECQNPQESKDPQTGATIAAPEKLSFENLASCTARKRAVIQESNRQLAEIEKMRSDTLAKDSAATIPTSTNLTDWLNPRSYLVGALEGTRVGMALTIVIIAAMIGIFMNLLNYLLEKDAKEKKGYRKNGLIALAILLLAVFLGPYIAAELSIVTASTPGAHTDNLLRKLTYSNHTDNCLDDGELSISNFYVPTGVMLHPGETANITITDYTMYYPLGTRPDGTRMEIRPADGDGHKGEVPENLNGERSCPECNSWPFMAVMAKVEETGRKVDPPVLIGAGNKINADQDGTGMIMLALNMPIRKPDPVSHLEANNEMAMLSGKVCWAITKSGTRR